MACILSIPPAMTSTSGCPSDLASTPSVCEPRNGSSQGADTGDFVGTRKRGWGSRADWLTWVSGLRPPTPALHWAVL